MRRRLLGAALGAVWLVGCGGGGGGGSKAPPQNLVTLLSNPCPSGVGNLPATTCLLLRVETAGNAPLDVELRVTQPAAGVPYLGSVVLCSGGGGSEFFADLFGGEELIRALTAIGLRVVDRRWEGGWLMGNTSFRQASARGAELLPWIRTNVHQGGMFFAVGNSGGSAELAYSLTTWGLEDLFDALVLSSGPPFTRLDYLCQPPSAAWAAQCPGFLPNFQCGAPPCSSPGNNICAGLAGLSAAEQQADSILHPGADTDFGALTTHVLMGLQDCTEWVAQGLAFADAITSPKTLQFVPDASHGVHETSAGRDAIVQALLGFAPLATSASPAARLGFSWTLLEDGERRAGLEASAVVR